jgi:hypothetical protein
LSELELPLDDRAAIVETFFFTFPLPQSGQTTSPTCPELRTSSSKLFPHSGQTNSKIGILHSCFNHVTATDVPFSIRCRIVQKVTESRRTITTSSMPFAPLASLAVLAVWL